MCASIQIRILAYDCFQIGLYTSWKGYLFTIFHVLDNFAFSEVRSQFGAGFRLYNQFAVFTYSQRQNNLPDSVVGNISDWKRYLTIDLSRTDLPFETADEFILNEDYHRLVTTSKLPRPRKFIEQTMSFCKSFFANPIWFPA